MTTRTNLPCRLCHRQVEAVKGGSCRYPTCESCRRTRANITLVLGKQSVLYRTPPHIQTRIAVYAARAAERLPLFGPGEPDQGQDE